MGTPNENQEAEFYMHSASEKKTLNVTPIKFAAAQSERLFQHDYPLLQRKLSIVSKYKVGTDVYFIDCYNEIHFGEIRDLSDFSATDYVYYDVMVTDYDKYADRVGAELHCVKERDIILDELIARKLAQARVKKDYTNKIANAMLGGIDGHS